MKIERSALFAPSLNRRMYGLARRASSASCRSGRLAANLLPGPLHAWPATAGAPCNRSTSHDFSATLIPRAFFARRGVSSSATAAADVTGTGISITAISGSKGHCCSMPVGRQGQTALKIIAAAAVVTTAMTTASVMYYNTLIGAANEEQARLAETVQWPKPRAGPPGG